jgi:hypothetical protein
LVGEINGESVRRNKPDNSALLGFIWEAPWHNSFVDAGIRRGLSSAAMDWAFTTGLTGWIFLPVVELPGIWKPESSDWAANPYCFLTNWFYIIFCAAFSGHS